MALNPQVEKLSKEVQSLKRTIQDMKETLTQQNNLIINLINKQNDTLKTLVRRSPTVVDSISSYSSNFPIQTQADLDEFEKSINDRNREQIVIVVKALLCTGGLIKNISKILSMQMILDYNIAGVHNKGRLQNYPNLLDILFRASYREGWNQTLFLDHLGKGLKLAKNKHFKNVSVLKKKQRESAVNAKRASSEVKNENIDSSDPLS